MNQDSSPLVLPDMLQDLRYSLRAILSQKAFALVLVVCLGTGIGVNATIFSVVDGVLIQPFPYSEPDRIVAMRMARPASGDENEGFSWLDLRDLIAQQTRLAAVAATSGRGVTLADSGEPDRYRAGAVSWNLFPMLGVAPLQGRPFAAQDDQPGAPGVVMLSEELWTLRYQADPGVLGRRVLINGQPHEIVGIMPKGFKFPDNRQLWVPLTPLAHREARDDRSLRVYGRLAPGATLAQAADDVRAVTARLAADYPSSNDGWQGQVMDLRTEHIPPDVSLVIWLMMGAATLVLFIACSNAANLLLARATVRRREISVRAALGAGRGRIVRQLLTESAVFGLLSVPLGLAIAWAGTQLLTASMPPDQVPYYVTWRVDWRAIVYAVVVAVGTAVVFGLVPAWHATRGTLHDDLKEGTRGNSGVRSLARNTLVIAQVSLAIVSLVGAALFVRTFINLDDYEIGLVSAPLMTMRVTLAGDEFAADGARARWVRDMVERFERVAGVRSVFASGLVPLNTGGGGGRLEIDGLLFEVGREPSSAIVGVTPAFFRTLGVTLIAGEDFTSAEGWSNATVAIVNQTLATRYFPNGSPLGRRVRVGQGGPDAPWFTIIGVAPDIKHDNIDTDDTPEPAVYVPYVWQDPQSPGFVVNVAGDPAAIMPALRAQIRAATATVPISAVRSMEEWRRLSFWEFALFGWVFSVIGGIALLLASVGVFGVLSYSVSQRTREIGVRMALGASEASVQALVMRQGLLLAGAGVVLGLAAAAVLTRNATALLYNVSATDPLSYTIVAVFLLVIAAAASWVPARRAMRISPVEALRGE
jgi:putative ABC transport system permease protein